MGSQMLLSPRRMGRLFPGESNLHKREFSRTVMLVIPRFPKGEV